MDPLIHEERKEKNGKQIPCGTSIHRHHRCSSWIGAIAVVEGTTVALHMLVVVLRFVHLSINNFFVFFQYEKFQFATLDSSGHFSDLHQYAE